MYTSKIKNGATLTIYRDESETMFAGWAFSIVSDKGQRSGFIDDLSDLFKLIKRTHPENLDGLPVFDRRAPENTYGVWTWDDTHMIVGDCPSSLDAVRRPDSILPSYR